MTAKPKSTPTVLVVDDEPFYHTVYGNALKKAHFAVSDSTSGDEALSMLKKQHVDAVVLDLLMPGSSGMTFLKHLDKHHAPPVVVLTSLDSPLDRQEALRSGAKAFMVKYRTSPEALSRMVEKVIGKS